MPPMPFIPSFGAAEGAGDGEVGGCGVEVEQPPAALSATSTAAITVVDLTLNPRCMVILVARPERQRASFGELVAGLGDGGADARDHDRRVTGDLDATGGR